MAYEAIHIPLHVNMPNERLALPHYIFPAGIFMVVLIRSAQLEHRKEDEDYGWYKFWKHGRNCTGALHGYRENQIMPLPEITLW